MVNSPSQLISRPDTPPPLCGTDWNVLPMPRPDISPARGGDGPASAFLIPNVPFRVFRVVRGYPAPPSRNPNFPPNQSKSNQFKPVGPPRHQVISPAPGFPGSHPPTTRAITLTQPEVTSTLCLQPSKLMENPFKTAKIKINPVSFHHGWPFQISSARTCPRFKPGDMSPSSKPVSCRRTPHGVAIAPLSQPVIPESRPEFPAKSSQIQPNQDKSRRFADHQRGRIGTRMAACGWSIRGTGPGSEFLL